jgi:hypothetical protein
MAEPNSQAAAGTGTTWGPASSVQTEPALNPPNREQPLALPGAKGLQ